MRPTGANTRMFAWRVSPISTAAPVTVMRAHCQEFGGPKQEWRRICGRRPRPSSDEFTFSQLAGLGVLVASAAATLIGKREHGTALGPAPDCLAVPAAPQFLGSRGAADGAWGNRARRLGRDGDERALSRRRGSSDQPRSVATARIRAPHGTTHGVRA